ncbi:MAG: hypothetical protein J6V87_04690 [Prevotella sp.]|nr:hypothetical protein [Prevotella sp.]
MRKIVLFAFCVAVAMISCKNKGQAAGETDADSTAVSDSAASVEQQDTTPLPMFLYYMNPSYMQTIYWTGVEEPKKDKDNAEYFDGMYASWSLQEMSRRNAAGYTKMLVDDNKWVDIKYIGEQLKNPDGEVMYGGELHSRPAIPSPGLKYALVNPKDAPKRDYEYGEFYIIVHQDYLKTRKVLKIEIPKNVKPMPKAVIKQMEEKYGMKAGRSMICSTIDGRYTQGFIQFNGEFKNAPKDKDRDYKKALALEVVADGDKVYAFEELGYYETEGGYCTWNADDGGEYCPTSIRAAFEGPDGLELCYEHGAPESSTVGIFRVRDGQLTQTEYECYHRLIDESTPLWKKDIAQLQKLFAGSSKGSLDKYQFLYLDEDNIEEIWMRSNDDNHGAVFTFKDGKPQLVAIEDDKTGIAFYQGNGKGYVKITSEDGSFRTTKFYAIKGSQVVERFSMKDLDGEITESKLNGKTLTKWEAADYLDKLPLNEYKVYPYWKDINEK